MTNTQKRYAQFNALTVTGRIFNAEIVTQADGSQFLAVSVISTATTDGADLVYKFNNDNGLMSLHQKGFFGKGREVTITGHIKNVSEVYTDKSGQVRMRKRPEISLVGVTVLDGGLGPMPKAENNVRAVAGTVVTQVGTPDEDLPPVDDTPAYSADAEQEEELALY